jgi:putative tricarboxylic transport membrane protein
VERPEIVYDRDGKNPASIVIGAGASIGSQDWMKAALLAQKANVDPHKMRYVAFEGGGEPVTALLGNHVQAVSGDLSEMVPYLQGNKIRVLAVFSNERLPGALADVPTAKEQGYDLVWPIIRGFFVGPKVSDAEYQWWVDEFTKLQQTEAFKKQRELRGLFEFNMNGKALDAYVKNRWKRIANRRKPLAWQIICGGCDERSYFCRSMAAALRGRNVYRLADPQRIRL